MMTTYNQKTKNLSYKITASHSIYNNPETKTYLASNRNHKILFTRAHTHNRLKVGER